MDPLSIGPFVALVGLILLLVTFHNNVFWNVILILLIILASTLFVAGVAIFSVDKLDENAKIKLLLEVIARKPPIVGVEWKVIAFNMNQYLYDRGYWRTPYRFYAMVILRSL